MSKAVIGVDIGACEVKFAVCEAGALRRLAAEPLPDNLVRGGRIVSPEAMSDFLRAAVAKHRLPGRRCAVSLPRAAAFTRRTSLPAMTEEQLRLNLPYEFRDFITEEKDKYVYDYALLRMERDEAGAPKEMELLACAALRETVRAYSDMFRRAGLRLRVAVPEEFAYMNLIRLYERRHPEEAGREHCLIDLGHEAVRVSIFTGPRFEATRVLEHGGALLDAAIAAELHVDEHLARAYKLADHEGARTLEGCHAVYAALAMDIQRTVNFYLYNDPGSRLARAWVCGGGARNPALMAQLRETLALELEPVDGLLPPGCEGEAALALAPAAAGATQQEGGAA